MAKRLHTLKTTMRDKPVTMTVSIIVLLLSLVGYAIYMNTKRLVVDPATYAPLLQLIARVESKSNDNAYFGSPHNTTINFTTMSIAEVLAWQARYVQQGSPSDAVGRYQIISPTLKGLVQQLGIDGTQKFDRPTQDRLAIALLERRGSERYVNGELTRQDFAANLAKEWAALPKATGENPESSYYAADGLNKSLVRINEVLQAIDVIKPR